MIFCESESVQTLTSSLTASQHWMKTERGLNSSEEWLQNTLSKLGVRKLSLTIFHYSGNICSQQGVTEFSLIMSLSKNSKTFLSDTAELQRGGAGCRPYFLRYWTVVYHTDFSCSCGYSRVLVVIASFWLQWHFPCKWRLILQSYYFQVGMFPKILINLYGITLLLVTKCIFLHWLFLSEKQLSDAWKAEK